MSPEQFDSIFESLKGEARARKFYFKSSLFTTEVCFSSKMIRVVYDNKTVNNLYCICHELGHVVEKNRKAELYRTNKPYRIYNEIKGWVLGYQFVLKYDLPKMGYWREACIHVSTYIKRPKPKNQTIN